MIPAIKAVGPPPERHADRIVAEMLRFLAVHQAKGWETAVEILRKSSDGSPKAQQKLVERIEKTTGLQLNLTPGKRGRYKVTFFDIMGWDPARDAEILIGDRIPEKPWASCSVCRLESKGGGKHDYTLKARPFLFVSHHALSRAAQRKGVKTMVDLMQVIHSAAVRVAALKDEWAQLVKEGAFARNVRIEGKDPETPAITMVLEKHLRREALVAKTMY